MVRPISRGVMSFGLVAIPVEIHTATKDQTVRFHLLHVKCGSRVRNQTVCPACNTAVERSDFVRGYELNKGQYVTLTEEELESLEAEANSNINLREFIPVGKVDPVYFESGYYLAPDQGGEKAYRLLSDAMAQTGRVALAEMVSHNKENLVLIRSANGGIILHFMFYSDEIRDFGAIPKGNHERLTPGEFELATRLLEKLSSDDFKPEAYTDEHRARVLAKLEEKKQGREITVSARPAPPRAGVVDLYAALKRSLGESKPPRQIAVARKKSAR